MRLSSVTSSKGSRQFFSSSSFMVRRWKQWCGPCAWLSQNPETNQKSRTMTDSSRRTSPTYNGRSALLVNHMGANFSLGTQQTTATTDNHHRTTRLVGMPNNDGYEMDVTNKKNTKEEFGWYSESFAISRREIATTVVATSNQGFTTDTSVIGWSRSDCIDCYHCCEQ